MGSILLIDGYNLIGALGSLQRDSLENLRNDLIDKLAAYKRVKGSNIVVVFDGEYSRMESEGQDRISGIDINYSRNGEKADDLILRMVRSVKGKYVVVTNDNDLMSKCASAGCTIMTSVEFIDKMELAAAFNGEYDDYDDYDDDYYSGKRMTKKKGNPSKLPKKERQRKVRLDKF